MKKTACSIILTLLIILAFAAKGASEETYGYEETNTAEDQKKFVEKLTQDNRKAEMAIRNTKTLIDRSRNRPYLPELYLRLAELYIERSRITYFLRSSESDGPQNSLTQYESRLFKNEAIEIYQRILDTFPDYDSRDKVHFFMAHEYRETGQLDSMVTHYTSIIEQHRDSVYVPESHLLLGDYYVNQLDLPAAEKHYTAVLGHPLSPAVSVARYKLAWVHINNADFKAALKLLEESIKSAPAGDLEIDTYKRVDIRFASLIDMAYCYTEVYKDKKPRETIAYFKKYAWSRPAYTAVLEKLAYRYFIKKKWDHAAVLYRHLSGLQQSADKLLTYARHIFDCVQALDSYENAERDINYIVKALRSQKYSVHTPRAEKEKNMTDFEIYARNIVTHIHDRARKKKSLPDFRHAADAYDVYLSFFEESPAYEEMEDNYAEALFSSGQYLEAGRRYEKIADRNLLKTEQKEEMLYSAASAFYKALKQKEDLNYYQSAYARGGIKSVGTLYASQFPQSSRVPDLLFNVAWISYDEGKYDEAINEFTEFIEQYPNGKPAKAAIHLTLDAYNLKEDYEGLINFGQKIINNRTINDNTLKAEVGKIVHASESKIVSSFTVAAMDDWETGKSTLVDYVEENKSSGLGEQVLNTLIASSREKGDLETLFATGGKLLSESSGSSGTEDMLGIMIDSSLKISQFRILAEYMEIFTEKFPAHDNAREFLIKAAQIRKGLGEYDQSNRDYRRILDRIKKQEKETDDIAFAMFDNFKQSGKHADADDFLKSMRRDLTVTGRIKADALISISYFEKGNHKESLRYQKKARKSYKNTYGAQDVYLKDLMTQMSYNALDSAHRSYMEKQLGSSIDNKLVAAKSKLLEQLEKGYLDVVSFKSPVWALKSFYRASEINREFARFLQEAPLPDLSPEEKPQYLKLIHDKAQGYAEKADQYLTTFKELVQKWELFDPKLSLYAMNSEGQGNNGSFSVSNSLSEIGIEFLVDEELKILHDTLMKDSKDVQTLHALAKGYLERGDYRQSMLIAQKAIEEIQGGNEPLKANFYNIIAISRIHSMHDKEAKYALKKALKLDPGQIDAKINLAGLYQYYGHTEQAHIIYESLPNTLLVEESTNLVHPKAKELYSAYINGT